LYPGAGSCLEFYIDSNVEAEQFQERTNGKEVVGFRIKTTMEQIEACGLQSGAGKVASCPPPLKMGET
jgi:hypothetical protein